MTKQRLQIQVHTYITYIDIFEEQKKRSAENERRKKEFDEDEGRLHPVVEKGEDPDDADILTVKEFQKKAQEFVKENFDKHRKKN